jgi:hypothetical protein
VTAPRWVVVVVTGVLGGAVTVGLTSWFKDPPIPKFILPRECPAPEECFARESPIDGLVRDDFLMVPRCLKVDGRSYDGPCIDGYMRVIHAIPAPQIGSTVPYPPEPR